MGLCSFSWLSPSLLLRESWRCGSHFVIMRQQARGWKLDNPKGEPNRSERSSDRMMCCYLYPARGCLPLDWRKRDPYMTKQLWLEFSIIYSCSYCWLIYQVSMNTAMKKKESNIYIFPIAYFIFIVACLNQAPNECYLGQHWSVEERQMALARDSSMSHYKKKHKPSYLNS